MTDVQGYADWKRTNQQVGDLLVNVPADHGHLGRDYGPFNVGAWAALLVTFTPATAVPTFAITVSWFADEAMTAPMGSTVYGSHVGARVVDELVNLGPWVLVHVFTANVAPDDVYACQVVPLSTVSTIARLIPGGATAFVSAVAVAAGGVSQTIGGYVTTGPAMLFVSGNQPCFGRLLAIDLLGGNAPFAFVNAPLITAGVAGNQVPIILPPSTIELDVFNIGAAGGVFFASVIPLP